MAGGADRVAQCSPLSEAGLTPPPGGVRAANRLGIAWRDDPPGGRFVAATGKLPAMGKVLA